MSKRIMPVRNKMMWFRMSEAEFQQVVDASNSAGSRCMSDYLRDVVLGGVQRASDPRPAVPDGLLPGAVLAQVRELQERIGSLENQMASVLKAVPVEH